jgi:uncharacterized membrane protein YgcG
MLVENFLIKKMKGQSKPTKAPEDPKEKAKQNTKAIVLAIFNVILAFIAGYLCWNCNAGEKPALRVIYTVFAAVFSGLYILFYFVYHVLLRVPCSGGSGSGSGSSSSVDAGDTIFDK